MVVTLDHNYEFLSCAYWARTRYFFSAGPGPRHLRSAASFIIHFQLLLKLKGCVRSEVVFRMIRRTQLDWPLVDCFEISHTDVGLAACCTWFWSWLNTPPRKRNSSRCEVESLRWVWNRNRDASDRAPFGPPFTWREVLRTEPNANLEAPWILTNTMGNTELGVVRVRYEARTNEFKLPGFSRCTFYWQCGFFCTQRNAQWSICERSAHKFGSSTACTKWIQSQRYRNRLWSRLQWVHLTRNVQLLHRVSLVTWQAAVLVSSQNVNSGGIHFCSKVFPAFCDASVKTRWSSVAWNSAGGIWEMTWSAAWMRACMSWNLVPFNTDLTLEKNQQSAGDRSGL